MAKLKHKFFYTELKSNHNGNFTYILKPKSTLHWWMFCILTFIEILFKYINVFIKGINKNGSSK